MISIFGYIAIVGLVGATYYLFKIVQLNKFSSFMDDKIRELFSTEEWRVKELNIEASYDNLSRSAAWNMKFDTMVVYDKVC